MGRKFRVKDNVKQGIVDYRIDEEMFVGNEYEDCFTDIFCKGDVYEIMNEHIINEYGDEDEDIEIELMCIEGKNKIELQELLSEETCEDDLYYSTIGMEYSSFCWEGVKNYFELID
jgi:hypothetical protein